jgi:hypothetical protein
MSDEEYELWRPNYTVNKDEVFLDVVLGGLVVSVLAIGPKVRGFNPGRFGFGFFKGDKNP